MPTVSSPSSALDGRLVVVLGTGGTIAGQSEQGGDNVGYRAGQIGVASLVDQLPGLEGQALLCEQVAQIDSKDMDFSVWSALAHRTAHHLERPDVAGVVIVHGTDTLEETAWFLHRILPADKPVVLTGAMRPATSLQPDGPQNLSDAIALASGRAGGAPHGVVAVMGGAVFGAADIRKVHPFHVQAFDAGDAGPLGWLEEGRLRPLRPWPANPAPLGLDALPTDETDWPAVDILFNTVSPRPALVDALVASGTRGIVAAGTGNGTLHHALADALERAQIRGVAVVRTTRCQQGAVLDAPGAPPALPSAATASPVKARIDLMLALMADNADEPAAGTR